MIIGQLILALLLLMPVALIWAVLVITRHVWRKAGPRRPLMRAGVALGGLLCLSSPYLAFKVYELHALYARVPEPLKVASVDYRLEESWGIGGPGDNETGFVVYSLTDDSAAWARTKGAQLGSALDDPKTHYADWLPTPVDIEVSQARWIDADAPGNMQTTKPTIGAYLDAYGFSIPVDREYRDQMDHVIQNPGSIYTYGRGGSITVVDPARGKVYFAYAG